ncbi:MAG: NAD-binding protein [Proteobacteria bacterium]|nr:NAD-binding protein [Pseudomonadota bacterium]
MKMLICGVGGIARELLRQLGDDWEITLIDISEEQLSRAVALKPDVKEVIAGDPSSSVVLETAGLAEAKYVLGLSRDHKVNLAVAEIALEAGVPHISVLVNQQEDLKELRERGVHALLAGKLVAGSLYHYLQDPRLRITPLALGPANIMEIRAAEHLLVVGKRAAFFRRRRSKLVGIFRKERLIFPQPETVILTEDRLVILGELSVFQEVCDLLECGNPHFPLAYGPGMLVAVPESEVNDMPQVVAEGLYLAQNIQVKSVTLLDGDPNADFSEVVDHWPQNISPETLFFEGDLDQAVREACKAGRFGLVVIPPLEQFLLSALTKPGHIRLAHDIARPLLVSKGTPPYERILVPFSGTAMSELALEIAVDFARQVGGGITAAVIEQPDFLTGEEYSSWKDATMARLNELSHVHKMPIEVVNRRGNPVREITALTSDFDLLVLGSTNRDRGIFTPNVGERLAQDAQCSVLILAF